MTHHKDSETESRVDVFYQGELLPEVNHVNVPAHEKLRELRARLLAQHGGDGTFLLFFEDEPKPADEAEEIGSRHGAKRLHLHRCHAITIVVFYAGRSVTATFGPGVTVAHLRKWAASQLGMSPDDAGEHVLQIAGTSERPPPGTHIGTLAKSPECRVSFDLLPDERVNGGCEGGR